MASRVALAALLAAAGTNAWTVVHTPLKLGSVGDMDLTDVDGDSIRIYAENPGCAIFPLLFTKGPYPLNVKRYAVVITDPDHDLQGNQQKHKNCADCNGLNCCRDPVNRANWRWLNESETVETSDNFCVPKGLKKSGPLKTMTNDDGDTEDAFASLSGADLDAAWAKYNDCDQQKYPGGHCQPWCEDANGPWQGPDYPCSACDHFPVNPSLCDGNDAHSDTGDCHFAHEMLIISHPVQNCSVITFGFQPNAQNKVGQKRHAIVAYGQDELVKVDNDPAVKIYDQLRVWWRMHVRNCHDTAQTQSDVENVADIGACGGTIEDDKEFGAPGYWHSILALRPDDGSSYIHSPSGEAFGHGSGWIDPIEKGIGEFCSGHFAGMGTECSPKTHIGDTDGINEDGSPTLHTDQNPQGTQGLYGWCRVTGCSRLSDAEAFELQWNMADSKPVACQYGNLMLSADYPINTTVAIPPMENICDNEDQFIAYAYVAGKPADTVASIDNPPNLCCDARAHEDWDLAPAPTQAPTTPPPTPQPAPTNAPVRQPTSGGPDRGGTGSQAGTKCVLPSGAQSYLDDCGVCGGAGSPCGAATMGVSLAIAVIALLSALL